MPRMARQPTAPRFRAIVADIRFAFARAVSVAVDQRRRRFDATTLARYGHLPDPEKPALPEPSERNSEISLADS